MLTALKNTWNELFAYLSRPFDQLDESASTGHKISRLFSVLAIDLAGAVVLMLLIQGISEMGWVDMEEHAVADAFKNMSIPAILGLAVVFGPLMEELIFRLPLRFESNPFMGLVRIMTPFQGTSSSDGSEADQRALRRSRLRSWWDRNYRWIFYLTAALFAYIHITNFKITTAVLLLSPVLVAAQFWMGSLAGFLRTRYGFLWAYLLHAIHNLILVGGAVLGDGPTEIVAIDNDDYHLMIEEVSIMSKDSTFSVYNEKDSLAFVNQELSDVLPVLLESEYDRVYFPTEGARDPKLNIHYGREAGSDVAKTTVLEALRKEYEFTIKPDPENELRAIVIFE